MYKKILLIILLLATFSFAVETVPVEIVEAVQEDVIRANDTFKPDNRSMGKFEVTAYSAE